MRTSLALALVCVAAPAYADDVVAVFDLEARGVKIDAKTRGSLTDYAATLLATDPRYAIVPPDEIRGALRREKAASYRECYDASCQIEIGKEIAANLTLSTTLSRIGRTCVVSMRLYDLRTSASVAAATTRGACSDDAYVYAIEKCVAELTGRDPPPTLVARTITFPAAAPVRRAPEPARVEPRTLDRAPLASERLLERDGRWSKRDRLAAKLLRRVAYDKRDPGTLFRLGVLYTQSTSKYDDAIEAFETILREAPRDEAASRARLELARLFVMRGDERRARDALESLDPEDPKTALLLGELDHAAERWSRAEAHYRVARRGDDRVATSARYRLAWLAFRARRDPAALAWLEEVASGPNAALASTARADRVYFCGMTDC